MPGVFKWTITRRGPVIANVIHTPGSIQLIVLEYACSASDSKTHRRRHSQLDFISSFNHVVHPVIRRSCSGGLSVRTARSNIRNDVPSAETSNPNPWIRGRTSSASDALKSAPTSPPPSHSIAPIDSVKVSASSNVFESYFFQLSIAVLIAVLTGS